MLAGLYAFGILQLICGCGLIIIEDSVESSILPTYRAGFHSVWFSGTWAGVFAMITGAFGVAMGGRLRVSQTPRFRQCFFITALVVSVLSLLVNICAIIVRSVYVAAFSRGGSDFDTCTYFLDQWLEEDICTDYWQRGFGLMGLGLGCHVLVFIAGLGQAIVVGVNSWKLRSQTVL
ncbi:uncharacterized protein LOC129596984 isoform X2 [Paramacrobiotus metropolitanus]|uniref:uncharacterized protein LOC129596984 isoform X2 n=1 Tax=Paramacrobiotus metropolitanus TaxID=2943436 RepID=UPI002445C557|nr:uncharacterized protein LOC129596984 isoform X2 [Paramacrobiotus metropolitanus]